MKAYILKGDPKELDKVLRENRIRADRGLISFSPVEPDMALDSDQVETLVESHKAMSEERQRLTVDNLELANLAGIVVINATEKGVELPEDVIERLSKFGITVPKIEQTAENPENSVPENDATPEKEAESVPNDSNTVTDEKNAEIGDMTEVNLDDVKDTPEEDTKEAPAPTPKKTRSKKSE